MPFQYAHCRFGAPFVPLLPAQAQPHRALYDAGLCGPDVFTCALGKHSRLAHDLHHRPGRHFFGAGLARLRREPSSQGLAYLCGVLGHYCLDSLCHPFIAASVGEATHIEIETEFDRFLLARDGRIPEQSQHVGRHLRLRRAEKAVAAGFYPGLTPGQFGAALDNLRRLLGLLAVPPGAVRQVLRKGAGAISRSLGGYFMGPGPDGRCLHLNEPLMDLYRRAQALYPRLLEQLLKSLRTGDPLGDDFAPEFG